MTRHLAFDVVAPHPVPSELQRGRWKPPLSKPVALATYTAVAMAVEEWDPVALERRVLAGASDLGHLDTPQYHLRRLLSGMPFFKPALVELQNQLPDVPVLYWANHPVFHLLALRESDVELDLVLLYALNSVSGPIRHHMWPFGHAEVLEGPANIGLARLPDPEQLKRALLDTGAAAQLSNVEWLTLALATFFAAERSNDRSLAAHAASVTNWTFLDAVLLNPPLLAGWSGVFEAMAKRVWERAGISSSLQSTYATLSTRLRILRRSNTLHYPPELIRISEQSRG